MTNESRPDPARAAENVPGPLEQLADNLTGRAAGDHSLEPGDVHDATRPSQRRPDADPQDADLPDADR